MPGHLRKMRSAWADTGIGKGEITLTGCAAGAPFFIATLSNIKRERCAAAVSHRGLIIFQSDKAEFHPFFSARLALYYSL